VKIPKNESFFLCFGIFFVTLKAEKKPSKTIGKIKVVHIAGRMVVYFEDTKQRLGSHCALDSRMLDELNLLLGSENVVVK
jgi:hypothetical protein